MHEVIPGNYPCSRCETIKPHTEFYKHNEKANGLASACKSCENSKRADSYRNLSEAGKTARYKATWAHRKARMAADPEYRLRVLSQKRPSKIRRKYKLRGLDHHTAAEWQALLDKYQNACLRCGFIGKLDRDHVLPLSMGGQDSIDNIQPLCPPCNNWKGAKHLDFRIK